MRAAMKPGVKCLLRFFSRGNAGGRFKNERLESEELLSSEGRVSGFGAIKISSFTLYFLSVKLCSHFFRNVSRPKREGYTDLQFKLLSVGSWWDGQHYNLYK